MNNTILVVEDSLTQAMILENILQNCNYQVFIVSDGLKALDWLKDNRPDLVISDVLMPKMDGYELCKQIKTQFGTSDIPVILLTSLTGTHEVIDGLIAGADSFITKPYDREYLIAHIAKILAEKKDALSEKKDFGVEIEFEGKKRFIQSDQKQIIKLLLSIYEGAVQQNSRLLQSQEQLRMLNDNLGTLVDERTAELSGEIEIRKKTEKNLKESEQRLQFVLQGSQLGYWDWNLETNEVKRNEQWAEMLGYRLDDIEFTVKQWLDFIHPDDRAKAQKSIGDHLEGAIPTHRVEYRMRTKDGNYKWILDQAQAVDWNSKGKPIRMSGTHTDITELKNAEESLKQKNEELVKINAEKDKFFSIIAHDLRGPFGAFMGLTEVLTEELPILNPAELTQLAETMRKSALNLNGLLNNLLEWARMHRGLISFKPEVINLLPFIKESTEVIMESAKNKNIDVEYFIPIDLQIFADGNTIQSVVRNLVSNAAKFTPKVGKIQVSARAVDLDNVEISVKDSGIGMNEKMMNHLFDIDVRTNRNGTDGEPSTGLGLILCKEFVERNNGKLWMESVEGVGSTFYFTVPSHPSPTNTAQNARSFPIAETENQPRQVQILISEDDNTSALLLKRLVSGYCNKVLMAVNGVEAVDICRSNPNLQLILMDINMPEMDGYEATRQIRSFNQNVVIIAQTAFVLDNDQKKVLQSGFNDFLSKPIAKEKLLAMLKYYFG